MPVNEQSSADPSRDGGQAAPAPPQNSFLVYLRYPAWPLLVFGYSAGFPYKALFAVIISLYLRELGHDLTTIFAFTLVGLCFSFKFLWSPVLDRPPLAAFMRIAGLRRTSLFLIQLLLASLFIALASVDARTQLTVFAVIVLGIAFLAATQDIVIDALRIELAGPEQQGVLAANYLIGYRAGLIAGLSLPLFVAEYTGSWPWALVVLALMFIPSMLTIWFIKEPSRPVDSAPPNENYARELLATLMTSIGDFIRRHPDCIVGVIALAMLYRFCDVLLGVAAYSFYADIGFSKYQIGTYSGVMGVLVTLVGGMAGGYLLFRMSWRKLLLVGLLLAAVSNFMFVILAVFGRADSDVLLVATIVTDNLAGGVATTVFIAWLSSLVNLHFTAVQYAVLSSLSTLPGKLIGASSGRLLDNTELAVAKFAADQSFILTTDAGKSAALMIAYALFFALTALVALPGWYIITRLPDRVIEPKFRTS
ncbi:MAG: MFS transporter [Gammaproteobacteria bacterium]|nr:MFS transporter [Pseudomonadota bacterium]MCH9663673.1 MFS transporter [Gammaproteobacteria bacterium]